MKPSDEHTDETNQYFEKLVNSNPQNKVANQAQKVAASHIESELETGGLTVPEEAKNNKKQEQLAQMLKKKEINPFQSRYRGFLLNNDRQKSEERYAIFKKLKQEYSKEKTAIVVKGVQSKIKQWASKQMQIDQRKQRSSERKKQREMKILEQMRKHELQKKAQQAARRKEQLKKRLKIIEQRRDQRQSHLKESSVRSKQIKMPKYIELETKFAQLQERLKEQQEKLLLQKRQAQILNLDQLRQHSKKYADILKAKEDNRAQRYKHANDETIHEKQQFVFFDEKNLKIKNQDALKRKRRREFDQRVKSMVVLKPKAIKSENAEDRESISTKKLQQSQVSKSKQKKDKIKHELDPTADRRKLGNDYLKQAKQMHKYLGKSVSLPKLKVRQQSTRLSYKNYLTELKIKVKPKGVGDEIQQIRRNCRSQAEMYQQLNKKSSNYEQKMINKIKELGKMNKYYDSVQKEMEIDDIHAKYIKMRLACIDS